MSVSQGNGRLVLPDHTKRTSVLRRMPPGLAVRVAEQCGLEGDVCAFALASGATPLSAEAVTGRAMTIAPGDVFLGTPGHRESTRWVVGSVPDGGLLPGNEYWVLADCGAVGAFIGDSPREKGHLGRVTFLGIALDADGGGLNIRQFAVGAAATVAKDHGAPVFLVVGTSSEVGKTTAAVNILRALRRSGRQRVVALKATGTSSLTELHSYEDSGAAPCFDCVDVSVGATRYWRRVRGGAGCVPVGRGRCGAGGMRRRHSGSQRARVPGCAGAAAAGCEGDPGGVGFARCAGGEDGAGGDGADRDIGHRAMHRHADDPAADAGSLRSAGVEFGAGRGAGAILTPRRMMRDGR